MSDLTAFVVVAEERSFTEASAKLGISQSSLSQISPHVGTSGAAAADADDPRSVAPTEAGERLPHNLVPALEELDTSLPAVSSLQDKPAGTIRITSAEHAAKIVIWPTLKKLLQQHPKINVAISLY